MQKRSKPREARLSRLDLLVTIPIERREGRFVLVQKKAGERRRARIPSRGSARATELGLDRALLQNLDRSVLDRVCGDSLVPQQPGQRSRRDIDAAAILALARAV